MKVLIDIPNYEFDNDVKDKFQDYFNRVKQDIANGTLCGNYELETTEMFLTSFKKLQVLPDNATNGDMVKAMFPNVDIKSHINLSGIKTVDIDFKDNMFGGVYSEHTFSKDWWNAPYKRGVDDESIN